MHSVFSAVSFLFGDITDRFAKDLSDCVLIFFTQSDLFSSGISELFV